MSYRDKVAGVEVEAGEGFQVHVFPRESRRGKAEWAIWVRPDGSGTMFVGGHQIELPKNGVHDRRPTKMVTGTNGVIEFVKE